MRNDTEIQSMSRKITRVRNQNKERLINKFKGMSKETKKQLGILRHSSLMLYAKGMYFSQISRQITIIIALFCRPMGNLDFNLITNAYG